MLDFSNSSGSFCYVVRSKQWIAQNVKKPPVTVSVIDFEFFGFNESIWVSKSPLGPKSHDTLEVLFRFRRYVEKNKVHFAPFLRFH
jgi:hypothetical protein